MTCLTIPEDGSLVRVFHAVPNATAVDVYVNEVLIFRNLNYSQFTDYIPLSQGSYTIRLFATGTTNPELLTSELLVPKGGIYTTIVTGNIDDLELLILEDSDTQTLASMQSKFRVVALAPNASALNLSMDNMPFIENIHFREMTAYVAVPANTYIISVSNALTNTMSLSFRILLKDGFTSTVYIIGDLPQLSALQSIDGSSYLCK